MMSKYLKGLLSLSLVTSIALLSWAEQPKFRSQNETQPLELRYLPKIFDAKIFKIDDNKAPHLKNLDINKLYGSGASISNNLCAFNIAAALTLITQYIHSAKFETMAQQSKYLEKISSMKFFFGENLEKRGQKVSSLPYPEHNALVIDSAFCEKLSEESNSGYTSMLKDTLEVAQISDPNFQISRSLNRRIQQLQKNKSVETKCKTDGCIMRKIAQNEAVKEWIASNDKCENSASWMQSFRKISNSQFEIICGDTSDRVLFILETRPVPDTFDLKHQVHVLRQEWIKNGVR